MPCRLLQSRELREGRLQARSVGRRSRATRGKRGTRVTRVTRVTRGTRGTRGKRGTRGTRGAIGARATVYHKWTMNIIPGTV